MVYVFKDRVQKDNNRPFLITKQKDGWYNTAFGSRPTLLSAQLECILFLADAKGEGVIYM